MNHTPLTHNCIMCGESFNPTSPEIAICPKCGGPPDATPEQRVGKAIQLDVGVSNQHLAVHEPPQREEAAAQERAMAASQVPLEWQTGDVILDLYEVQGELGRGGMGVVYKVRHRGWDMELAVKSPLQKALDRVGGEGAFIAEAEAWIDLGLHPHIATCYYVRKLGPVPRLFAEYVQGGSLSQWIAKGKLRDLESVLDTAIQFAWGLDYAHQQELMHKDVKPDNVLMTTDGAVKVTDFGQAKAKAGYSPPYCSPEQAAAQFDSSIKLTPATDIWSWALSILEVFAGSHYWVNPAMDEYAWGQLAPQALQDYLDGEVDQPAIAHMPERLSELLRECFREIPDERPEGMGVVAERLVEIYQGEIGRPYPREQPQAVDLRADSSNNKALSMLDIGQEEEAVKAWEGALQSDPHHAEATYNFGLWRWRTVQQTDQDLVRQLEAMTISQSGNWHPHYLSGLVHLERGDRESAESALMKAAKMAPSEPEVQEALNNLDLVGDICLRTFEVNTRAVAVTPDGRHIVFGSLDNTLKLWDLSTGECLRTFTGHRDSIRDVAILPGGRCALSASRDKTLRLWELDSGHCLDTFKGHTDSVEAISITPDGLYAVSGSGSGDATLRLWDLWRGRCIRTYEGHTRLVRALAITPDGQRIISGSSDKTLRIWELASGKCLQVFDREKSIYSLAITPDGRNIVLGSEMLEIWDLTSNECLQSFPGHTDLRLSLAITPNGSYCVSGAEYDTMRLWELATGRCLRTYEEHKGLIYDIAITTDGRYVVSANDFDIRLWGLEGVGKVFAKWVFNRPTSVVRAVEAAAAMHKEIETARKLLISDQPAKAGEALKRARSLPGFERDLNVLELWRLAGLRGGRAIGLLTGHYLRSFEGHTGVVTDIAITPGGSRVLSGSGDGLRLWDIESGECTCTFEKHKSGFSAVAITPDGRCALSGSSDYLRLWELDSGHCLRTFKGHKGRVAAVSITPDGQYAISYGGSEEKKLRLWDLSNGECLRVFGEGNDHNIYFNDIAITPDGHYLVMGQGETLQLWDLERGQSIRSFVGHKDTVSSCAITPDGRYVLSGSWDKTLRLWELDSGRCLRTFKGHEAWLQAIAVTPDGRFMVSAAEEEELLFWELSSGKCLRAFEEHADYWSNAVAFTPEGRYLISGDEGGNLRIWELAWDYIFPEPTEWDEGAQPYLEIFLTLHTPYGPDGLSRIGKPTWTEEDFQQLLVELGYRGYGWLRPEGVRHELEKMAAERR